MWISKCQMQTYIAHSRKKPLMRSTLLHKYFIILCEQSLIVIYRWACDKNRLNMSIKRWNMLFHRHLLRPVSCWATQSRSACSPTATHVYFTPSDVRARSSVVTRVGVKTFPWQPLHVIQTLDRFSSRRLELQLATSWLAQRWMFWRQWLPSSSASWCFGLYQHSPTYFNLLGWASSSSQRSTVVQNTVVRAVWKWIGKPRFWTPVAP